MNVDDVDEAHLRLFRARVPERELWAKDPGLRALPMTRELLDITSPNLYISRTAGARKWLFRMDGPREHR